MYRYAFIKVPVKEALLLLLLFFYILKTQSARRRCRPAVFVPRVNTILVKTTDKKAVHYIYIYSIEKMYGLVLMFLSFALRYALSSLPLWRDT